MHVLAYSASRKHVVSVIQLVCLRWELPTVRFAYDGAAFGIFGPRWELPMIVPTTS